MAQELLLRAAQHGDIEEAALLMEKGHACPDFAMPPLNTTPLHAACRHGHLDMVNLLIASRADPNRKEVTQCGARTPLHLAAQANLTSIATTLLAGGADPIKRDSRGQTPLHLAALEGQADVTRLLLARGADPNVRDYAGFNAAWWAKEFKFQDVLEEYAALQVEPQKLTARERLAISGVRPKVGGGKKKKADRDGSPSKGKKK
eukprot:TRINITY_DN41921_c0_g1_i1.p1 TRINITY_DN41921_c0_g1~~TRINITY_DN41921_c0_g1_i1.p1  ORF type:complete len:204 (-),score=38.83 TRINITY_DN41921_c0_g1_i1:37-648(-)